MEKISKFQTFTIIICLSILSFFFIPLWIKYGVLIALQVSLLIWSLFILCIPANHGKNVLGIPYKKITGKKLFCPAIYMWSAAILLNMFYYFYNPIMYFHALSTHLLFKIISTPWPLWIIIFASSLAMFYKLFFGKKILKSKRGLHYVILSLLIITGLLVFMIFSFKEAVMLLNIRA